MLSAQWLQTLARYNHWMNEKLYDVASQLTDEVRKQDLGAFFKSIHGTFNHLLLADRVWLSRFQGVDVGEGLMGPGIRSLDQELYADFDELRAERSATDGELTAWATTLDEDQLRASFVYGRRGKTFEEPLWWAATHLFNHQTHHRGQITTLLKQQGHDPGSTDLLAMLRSE